MYLNKHNAWFSLFLLINSQSCNMLFFQVDASCHVPKYWGSYGQTESNHILSMACYQEIQKYHNEHFYIIPREYVCLLQIMKLISNTKKY